MIVDTFRNFLISSDRKYLNGSFFLQYENHVCRINIAWQYVELAKRLKSESSQTSSKSLIYGNWTSHQIPSYPACISLARGIKVTWVGFLKIFYIRIYKFASNKRFILFPRIGTQTKDRKFLETSLIIFSTTSCS